MALPPGAQVRRSEPRLRTKVGKIQWVQGECKGAAWEGRPDFSAYDKNSGPQGAGRGVSAPRRWALKEMWEERADKFLFQKLPKDHQT